MRRYWGALALGFCLLVSWGCQGGAEKEAAQQAAALNADSTWLQENKPKLDAKRGELAALQARAAAGEELAVQLAAAEKETMEMSDEFSSRLVAFLNADAPIAGEKPSERWAAALRMKSAEDILMAHEYIEKGGDHKRAIDILEGALAVDAENADLKRELGQAQASRHMNQQRFELAKKGMDEAAVRQVLGQPNPRNIKVYPDGKVAWLYRTGEGPGAAAVYFHEDKKSGKLVVYKTDFEAIKAAGAGAE